MKMPKKFAGENSKAAAAKERKSEKAEAERLKKEKAAEDALWQDDDKSLAKKQVSINLSSVTECGITQTVSGQW